MLITGASSGIGRALAARAASKGARIGIIARRQAVLEAVAGEIKASGGQAAWEAVDVTDRLALAASVARLETALGPCDVLVANAGVYRKTDGAAYDAARAAEVFSANIIGVSNSLGAVLPGMVARRHGHLCAIASLGALLSLPAGGAYCASKAAVATLMKSIRLDVAKHGVSVTTVFPGFVDTPMITDHERQTLRGVYSADASARHILWAIERGCREHSFPFGLWLECWLGGKLPWWLYKRIVGSVPPMEET